MAISLGVTSNLTIDQNLAVGGSATITSGLTLSSTTASSLLYGNTLKAVSSVILSSNLSLTTGTLALAAALTDINSVTAATGQSLTLTGGTSGASLVLGQGTSAKGVFTGGSATGMSLDLVRTTGTAVSNGTFAQINGYNGTANRAAIIDMSSAGAADSGHIDFWTKATGTGIAQVGRLTSTGNLLIGTSTDITGTGNLAVAGGTVTAGAGSTALTLSGGNSGASLVLGQGATAGAATLTATGTGTVVAATAAATRTAFDISNTSTGPTKNGFRILGANASSADSRQWSFTANDFAYGDLSIRQSSAAATDPLSGTSALYISAARNLLIGGTTDITGSGGLKVFGSTPATSYVTGSIQSVGGAGINGAVWADGTAGSTITGQGLVVRGGNTTFSTNIAEFRIFGGTTATTAIAGDGSVRAFANVAATNTTTGSIVVGGGIGVSGAGYFGGVLASQGPTGLPSQVGGQILLSGNDTAATNRIFYGDGSGYSLKFATRVTGVTTDRVTLTDGGVISIANTSGSVGSTSGALQVAGGIYAGAASVFAGNVNAVSNFNVGPIGSDFAAGRINILTASDTVPGLSFGGSNYGFSILEKTDGDLYFARRQGSTTNTTWMSVSRATGAAAFTGNVGIGGAAATDRKLQISGNTTAGADQFGTVFLGTFSNSATSSGTVEYLRLATQAAAYTMASGVTLQLVSPNIGAGSAVTTHTAISIQNPGAAGITNAYGIDIAAVSGAATTNIGLRNAGTTVLTNATVSTLSTNGALVVTGGVGVGGTSVFGDTVTVSKSQNATTSLSVQNGNGGTASASVLSVGNDTSFSRGNLYAFGTGYTTSNQYVAGSVLLEATAAPGLGISGTNGGPVKIWNNAGLTATFAATGITFASAVTMTGSLFFNTGTNTPIVPSYMNVGAATGADENLLSFGNAARSGVLRGNQSGSNIAMWSFSYGSSGPTYLEGVRVTAGLSLANTYLNVYGTAAATSTASGALQVAGGAGFAKAIYVNQNTFIDGAAGTFRSLQYTAANVNRWGIGASNAAESGSNVGSDLIFNRWSDAGADLGTVLTLTRSTGAATFTGQVTISSAAPYQLLTATAGTNYAYTEYINTGNNLRIGLENSAGASIVPGAPAYAAFIASVGARSLVFATNNIVRQTIDSAGATTFTSAVTINSGGLYATGAASTFDANAVATDLVLTLRTLTAGSASSRSTITNKAASGLIEFNSDAGSNGTGNGYDFKARGISRLSIDSVGAATFVGTLATGGAASIGVAVSTGLGFNVNLNPGTLTYGAANAWIGARIRPARAATTGNAFAISGQLEVTSGTQTSGATFISEAPSGTITNHTYFYANSSGSRVVPTGNYSFYAESAAGAAYIGNATASTGIGFGALQVAGGIYVGAASVFAGDVAFNVGRNTVGDAFYSYSANVFTFGSGNAAQSARIFSGGNAALTFDTSRAATFAGTVTTLGRILAIGTIRTAAYTVTTSDHVVVCNNATTPFTVTLIAASSNTGRQFIIKNKGVATITMDATSLGTIDGSNTMTLTTNQAATLVSDGVQWNRI